MQTKSGKSIHPIGIGTWNIASRRNPNVASKYGDVEAVRDNEPAEIEAIRYSIRKGQNHIHCAELYGATHTNEVVGRAITEFPRQDLYVTNMLWKTSMAKGLVRPAVEQMLEQLGTDYIDLLYIHYPYDGWREAVPQIDELIDEGIVCGFGVSNFTIGDMEQALSIAKHAIIANQMNYNVLYKSEVDQTFQDFCKQQGIAIVAYQPIKRQEVLQNATVQEIAVAYQATPAQVALAWLITKGALPIPKATQKAHIDENLGALDVRLSSEDLTKLDAL